MSIKAKLETYVVVLVLVCSICVSYFVISSHLSNVDSDNDGVTDNNDAFPFDYYEAEDTDGDGIGDNSDSFPFDQSASVDSDNDGYPDYWNPGKSQVDSTSVPSLQLDAFPYNPSEWCDGDGDGVGDNSDVFPQDPTESKDTDGDGVGDNKDANPLVNLSFSLSLYRCRLTGNVDLLPWGQLYVGVRINDNSMQIFDNNETYWKVRKNKDFSLPIHLEYDVDDGTSSPFTTIEIILYDSDWIFKDDIVDINPDTIEHSLKLIINHADNSVDAPGMTQGSQATLWYALILPEPITPPDETINITYKWTFEKQVYSLSIEVPSETYEWYVEKPVNRSPQMRGSFAMRSFVTSTDDVIVSLARSLQSLASYQGFDSVRFGNFILSFVQQNIRYATDNMSEGVEEYWRYPVETLVEKQGDCEDSTLLFVSLMKQLEYKTALLFYIIDENVGHLAAGIAVEEPIQDGFVVTFNNLEYYYCESTSQGFIIGEKPSDIPDDPELVIPL
jgi:transglutaminase-like putative cysteine protease